MSTSRAHDIVARAARQLGLMNAAGKLVELDSLTVVDLVLSIEEATGLRIPLAKMQPDVFRDLESIVRMVSELPGFAGGRAPEQP